MAGYQAIFENVPFGLTLRDAEDHTLLDANEQYCDILGYKKEELFELDFDDLHVNEPPYTNDKARQYIQKAATDGSQTFEWLDETKGGDAKPVEVTVSFITLDGQERILSVVQDISGRKHLEEQLDHKNERLDKLANLVEKDLQCYLDKINVQINNPPEGCDCDEYHAVIEAKISRMNELTECILTLARGCESANVEET